MLVSAARSLPDDLGDVYDTVRTLTDLARAGFGRDDVRSQVAARRWQRCGRAVVLHNGELHPAERDVAALINAGPRSMFTGFTAAQLSGLQGWERPWTDVLVPGGARVRRVPGVPVRVHYSGDWPAVRRRRARPVEALAPALVRAAGTLARPRSACGLLAAAVQQRLVRSAQVIEAVEAATRVRHRALLLSAAHDIAQGSQALSEIDLARLCRRHGLPPPDRQVVRRDRFGRRRYLDGEWRRHRDGRRVVVEVDGALHLIVQQWWSDQVRQNEIVLADAVVLRFPSALLRCEEPLVADQLRRSLR